MFVYAMGCSFRGWGVCIWAGVLKNWMECYLPGWVVSIWYRVLVNGIEC